jgi:hypothetical protein
MTNFLFFIAGAITVWAVRDYRRFAAEQRARFRKH